MTKSVRLSLGSLYLQRYDDMKISIWDRVVLSDLNSSQSDEPIESRPVTCTLSNVTRVVSVRMDVGLMPTGRVVPGLNSEPTQLGQLRR